MTLEERIIEWVHRNECITIDGPRTAYFRHAGRNHPYVTVATQGPELLVAEEALFHMLTAESGHIVWRKKPVCEALPEGGFRVSCRYVLLPRHSLGAFQ